MFNVTNKPDYRVGIFVASRIILQQIGVFDIQQKLFVLSCSISIYISLSNKNEILKKDAMGFKKGNNEIVLWWLFLNWCWSGVDVVLVWKWYVALMLRWCGHSVSGSGPEPCQVSTLLLGDTGPPFQLIGRLLLSPHPKKNNVKKWTISPQSVLSNWDRFASGWRGNHFMGFESVDRNGDKSFLLWFVYIC